MYINKSIENLLSFWLIIMFVLVSSIIVVYFAEIHNVFSSMKDEGRFILKKELILIKGGLKPIKN